jgi:hypothetical protein
VKKAKSDSVTNISLERKNEFIQPINCRFPFLSQLLIVTKHFSVFAMTSFWEVLVLLLLLGSEDNTVVGTELKFDGDEHLSHIVSPLPYTYMDQSRLPKHFFWGNVGGKSYLTHMLNQHIPQCKREIYILGRCLIFIPHLID